MKRQTKTHRADAKMRHALFAYYATLLLFAMGIYLSGFRAWGINILAYMPFPVSLTIITFLAVVPALLHRLKFVTQEIPPSTIEPRVTLRTEVVGTLAVVLGAGLSFYFLRAQTHFFGDGYALLANLGKWVPYAKPTEMGTDLLVQWIAGAVNVTTKELAERTFQIVSMGSGLTLVGATVVFSRVLFVRLSHRVLFMCMTLSGGQMLLFFGYVENYAPLSLCVALFTMIGLCSAQNKCHKLWIVAPLVLAVWFHLVALVMLPAALYLLLRDTTWGVRLRQMSKSTRMGIAGVAVALMAVSIVIATRSSLFLQLALIPLVAGRFTARDYTLFSFTHVLDFANLILLLSPGLLICLATIPRKQLRSIWKRPENMFLSVTVLSTVGAAFVLDPKLGMGRDWDLFSVSAFPILALFASLLISRADRVGRTALLLASIVSLAVLIPRAVVQHLPERGAHLAEDLMRSDVARSRNGLAILMDYHSTTGSQRKAAEIGQYRDSVYPEVTAIRQASALLGAGQMPQAKQILDAVVERTPNYALAWAWRSVYFYRTGQYDSSLAMAQIADGLNPNNPVVLFNMGLAYYALGQPSMAEPLWLKSVRIDSTYAALSLAHLYRDRGDSAKYLEFLMPVAFRPSARSEELKEAALLLIGKDRFKEASVMLRRYETAGGDTIWVDGLFKSFPELQR